ncbi:hypothetical protein [Desulfitobacterium hafniense]|nr:hypothetical protein [Desulfitobacterium hafniense]
MKKLKEDILEREGVSVINTKEFDELTSLFKTAIEKEVNEFDQYQWLINKTFERKSLAKSVVLDTHSFSEYLTSLINFHEIDPDYIYAIVEIDQETLEGLKEGRIAPWHLEHKKVFSLLNAINGLYKDALKKIKETEIYIDENAAMKTDLGLVARSDRKLNSNRRDMFSDKTIKFLKVAEQRKKNELIEAICNALN